MRLIIFTAAIALFGSIFINSNLSAQDNLASLPRDTSEKHLKNLRQITFGGDNAEAYFSFDNKKLSFQSNNKVWGLQCDQIFDLDIKKALKKGKDYKPNLISTGNGRTTCSYYLPDGKHIIFASTHKADKQCPPPPAERKDRKYLWQVFPTYNIFVADLKGNIVKQLTDLNCYNAEATVSPKGDKIVFTSTRSGDSELWTMNLDGSNQTQITNELGYDGGAFFSPDGSQIVFRASRPKTEADIAQYKELLEEGLVMPTEMELFVCNADGSNLKQLTHLGKANWAPFFHPSGKKIIFASNHHAQKGYDFQLYTINLDGTNLERITNASIFNAFPMFSPSGKQLIFSSNRDNGNTRDTNLFIADWVD